MPSAQARRRARRDREYDKARREFLGPIPRRCKATIDHDCSGTATDVHHLQGRDERVFMDRSLWLEVCSDGHKAIHANPEQSYALGLLIPRNGVHDAEG